MSITIQDILLRYEDLVGLVDSHVEGVHAAMEKHIHCSRGCAACCERDSLSSIEGWRIFDYSLENRIVPGEYFKGCPFLFESVCLVYNVRPIICRSHGIPIKTGEHVHCCELNFSGIDDLEAAMILDQDLVDRHLGIIDLAFRQTTNDIFFQQERIKFADLALLIRTALSEEPR